MAPPVKTEVNADAVARAAIERAEKAEARIKELEAKLAAPSSAPSPKKNKAVVPGTKRYRLKTDHFRKGNYLPAGTVITATDEVPGKHWEPLAEKPATQLVPAEAQGDSNKPPRAADAEV
jgi:hypothetical protein